MFALPKPPVPTRKIDRGRSKLDQELTVDIPNHSPNSSNSGRLDSVVFIRRDFFYTLFSTRILKDQSEGGKKIKIKFYLLT
jgi:hypothetical protein